ncbi:MAG: Ig-like domain-containing protein [Acidobacteriota bacterium]
MRWRGAPTKSAPVDVNTRSLDFGTTVVGGRTIRVLTLSNTAAFTLTVKAARFNGSCFDVAPTASLPLVIPPKGQAELPVVFSPASPGICPGTLVLEVDSAGGRFKQVRLEGRGK